MKRRFGILALAASLAAAAALVPPGAPAAVKYSKIASFKDVGQSRVFFISVDEKVPADQLEPALWEIVNFHMDTYGQAPQMWIYFFDNKKFAPKDFPIQGDTLDHLVATYFYATDNRTKKLEILDGEDIKLLKSKGKIDSPLWQGQ
jgi:hypothetical protein